MALRQRPKRAGSLSPRFQPAQTCDQGPGAGGGGDGGGWCVVIRGNSTCFMAFCTPGVVRPRAQKGHSRAAVLNDNGMYNPMPLPANTCLLQGMLNARRRVHLQRNAGKYPHMEVCLHKALLYKHVAKCSYTPPPYLCSLPSLPNPPKHDVQYLGFQANNPPRFRPSVRSQTATTLPTPPHLPVHPGTCSSQDHSWPHQPPAAPLRLPLPLHSR